MSREIVLYCAELCSDCQKLKDFMMEAEIEFELRDIQANPEHRAELEANTGKLGVPYLVIDGEWVRGYEIDKPFSEAFARSLFE